MLQLHPEQEVLSLVIEVAHLVSPGRLMPPGVRTIVLVLQFHLQGITHHLQDPAHQDVLQSVQAPDHPVRVHLIGLHQVEALQDHRLLHQADQAAVVVEDRVVVQVVDQEVKGK